MCCQVVMYWPDAHIISESYSDIHLRLIDGYTLLPSLGVQLIRLAIIWPEIIAANMTCRPGMKHNIILLLVCKKWTKTIFQNITLYRIEEWTINKIQEILISIDKDFWRTATRNSRTVDALRDYFEGQWILRSTVFFFAGEKSMSWRHHDAVARASTRI